MFFFLYEILKRRLLAALRLFDQHKKHPLIFLFNISRNEPYQAKRLFLENSGVKHPPAFWNSIFSLILG